MITGAMNATARNISPEHYLCYHTSRVSYSMPSIQLHVFLCYSKIVHSTLPFKLLIPELASMSNWQLKFARRVFDRGAICPSHPKRLGGQAEVE